jgi:hypothetical protein
MPLERAAPLFRVKKTTAGYADIAEPVRDRDLFVNHFTCCPEPGRPGNRSRKGKLP